MKKSSKIFSLIFFTSTVIFSLSCKKEQITTHENKVINGNIAPPYEGISTLQIEVYVNKLYIDLLGVQPTNLELTTDVNYLKSNKLRMGARDTLIDRLISNPLYYKRLFTINSGKFIEGVNEFQINQEIATQTYIIALLAARGDTFLSQVVEMTRDNLIILKQSDSLYKDGSLTLNEFYAIFTNNQFFDDLNMGSLNFVKASFEYYFIRQGSEEEIKNGVKMVDGESVILLLKNGNSKTDFIHIITNSDEFYQGLVIENYRAFLARNPTTHESFTSTQAIISSNDLSELKKSILKLDEYAGFN